MRPLYFIVSAFVPVYLFACFCLCFHVCVFVCISVHSLPCISPCIIVFPKTSHHILFSVIFHFLVKIFTFFRPALPWQLFHLVHILSHPSFSNPAIIPFSYFLLCFPSIRSCLSVQVTIIFHTSINSFTHFLSQFQSIHSFIHSFIHSSSTTQHSLIIPSAYPFIHSSSIFSFHPFITCLEVDIKNWLVYQNKNRSFREKKLAPHLSAKKTTKCIKM